MGGERIDWEDLTRAFNRIKNANYKSSKEMLNDLYTQKRKGVIRLSRLLGPSTTAIYKQLSRSGIKIRVRQYDRDSPKKSMFLDIDPKRMKTMTKNEIVRECGFITNCYFYMLMDKTGRSYKLVAGSRKPKRR